jgi:hypothetical protein
MMHERAANRLTNIDIVILTKLNELAERYELKPYEFVATARYEPDPNQRFLTFEWPLAGSHELRDERFVKMFQALGVDRKNTLQGTDAQVIDALDKALQLAPKPRLRF